MSGAEKHSGDKGHSVEVYDAGESVGVCLCWDIFCCQGLHASSKPQMNYSILDTSELRDSGDAAANPDLCSTGV